MTVTDLDLAPVVRSRGVTDPDIQLHSVPSIPVADLVEAIAFQQLSLRMYGKDVPQPRLVAWYGPCDYTYSRLTLPAQSLPERLQGLMAVASDLAGEQFNSVMCNLYRDGSDSVAWHADDEPEFGGDPVIASMSFGATRRFAVRDNAQKTRTTWDLTDGSVLVMGRGVQPNYQHSIAKTKKPVGQRVNLTFRRTV